MITAAPLLLAAASGWSASSSAGGGHPMPVVSVDARAPTHAVNPLFVGRHSDSGFAHTYAHKTEDIFTHFHHLQL